MNKHTSQKDYEKTSQQIYVHILCLVPWDLPDSLLTFNLYLVPLIKHLVNKLEAEHTQRQKQKGDRFIFYRHSCLTSLESDNPEII
jgi:hypothetical protein